MPAPDWSMLVLAVAAAALLRRRVTAADPPAGVVTPPRQTVADILSAEPTSSSVYAMAYAGCPDREIAARYQLGEAEVRQRFGPELSVGRAMRAFALRRGQTDLAIGPPGGGKPAGHGSTLQWLGRNELGQSLSPTEPGQPDPSFELE